MSEEPPKTDGRKSLEYRAMLAARMRTLRSSPKFQEARSRAIKEYYADPEHQSDASERAKALHAAGRIGRKRLGIPDSYKKLYGKLRRELGPTEALRQITALIEKETRGAK